MQFSYDCNNLHRNCTQCNFSYKTFLEPSTMNNATVQSEITHFIAEHEAQRKTYAHTDTIAWARKRVLIRSQWKIFQTQKLVIVRAGCDVLEMSKWLACFGPSHIIEGSLPYNRIISNLSRGTAGFWVEKRWYPNDNFVYFWNKGSKNGGCWIGAW